METRPPREIQIKELMIIRTTEGARWTKKLRVVELTIDGLIKAPRIESRLWYANAAPQGRPVGMEFEDAQAIVDQWPEIRAQWLGK